MRSKTLNLKFRAIHITHRQLRSARKTRQQIPMMHPTFLRETEVTIYLKYNRIHRRRYCKPRPKQFMMVWYLLPYWYFWRAVFFSDFLPKSLAKVDNKVLQNNAFFFIRRTYLSRKDPRRKAEHIRELTFNELMQHRRQVKKRCGIREFPLLKVNFTAYGHTYRIDWSVRKRFQHPITKDNSIEALKKPQYDIMRSIRP